MSEAAGPEAVAVEPARAPLVEALAAQPAPGRASAGSAFLAAGAGPAIARLAHSNAVAQRVALMRAVQRGAGNAHAGRLLREAAGDPAPTQESAPPAGGAGGPASTGAGGPTGGATLVVEETFVPAEFGALPDEDLHVQIVGPGGEGGFVDGGQTGTAAHGEGADEHVPQAFTDGAMTGTVKWAGGGGAGAHGNEPAGSIQAQTAPVYESRLNAGGKDADAWVRPGTGTVTVRRSWVGIAAGDQGNGHFVTVAAAARINAHEPLHVNSTKGFHDANIKPLEARIADRTLGLGVAAAEAAAIAVLKAAIKWPETLKAFQDADLAANKPMGPVDTADLATGTYPVDAGPGVVGGKNYQHRLRTPGEPNPT